MHVRGDVFTSLATTAAITAAATAEWGAPVHKHTSSSTYASSATPYWQKDPQQLFVVVDDDVVILTLPIVVPDPSLAIQEMKSVLSPYQGVTVKHNIIR